MARVDCTGECWLWTGPKSLGYGIVWMKYARVGLIQMRAHRVAYNLFIGPIPDGLWVLHKCDNPPCVRPEHLFLGTPAENTADSIRKGRRGHGAKLTPDQVREIRRADKRGIRRSIIAEKYGVCKGTISAIAQRRRWRDITDHI